MTTKTYYLTLSTGIVQPVVWNGETPFPLPDGASISATPPELAPAPVVVPESITPRQIRLWLLSFGIPLAAIDQALTTDAAKVEWEFASEIRRDHPLVEALRLALALSHDQVDSAFIVASNL